MDTSDSYEELVPREDNEGNMIRLTTFLIGRYDEAVRTGDYDFIHSFLEKYGHVDIPVLNGSALEILEQADHEALILLTDQEFITLPDIVMAIIYREPYYLHGLLNDEVIRLILRYDAYDLFLQYRRTILKRLKECPSCMRDWRIGKRIASVLKEEILFPVNSG